VTLLRERARRAFADGVETLGPGWKITAHSVRAGYENLWIRAGIAALERVLRLVPDDDEDDQDERA
jgi:hypothetical protein